MKKMFMLIVLVTLTISFVFSEEINNDLGQTIYFSFASDDFHNGPTFEGDKDRIWGKAIVDLVVDINEDNNGGQVQFLSIFTMEAQVYNYRRYFIGNQWLHVWKCAAKITFYHMNQPGDPVILEINFEEGVITSWSPNPDTIGETMTLQNSESADKGISMIPYNQLKCIVGTDLNYSEDIAFTFTNVRGESIFNLIKVPNGYFEEPWKSEGSFSGSAFKRDLIIK